MKTYLDIEQAAHAANRIARKTGRHQAVVWHNGRYATRPLDDVYGTEDLPYRTDDPFSPTAA